MADISFRDWFELPPSLLLPPPFSLVVPPAIDAVCDLYRRFPEEMDVIVSNIPGAPSGTGGYVLNRLCPLPPGQPPPPMRPPFSGGQCCELYDVTTSLDFGDGASVSTFTLLPGKIRGLEWRDQTIAPNLFTGQWVLMYGGDCPGTVPAELSIGGGQNMSSVPICRILSVVKSDGSPDTCGSPPPRFEPGNPSPDDFDIDIDVDIGGDNYNFPITISPPNPDTNYPFRPNININIGDNITVNVGGDGLTIGFNPSPPEDRQPQPPNPIPPGDRPPPVYPPPLFPPAPPGDVGTPGDCPDVNLVPVLNAIADVDADLALVAADVKELLDCDRCEKPQPGLCRKALLGSGQSGDYVVGGDCEWVGIEISVVPENAKSQWGVDAPDVYYAGWYSVGDAESLGDRHPVAYLENVYEIAAGLSRFAYTLQSGYSASCYAYFKREED